MTTEITNIVSNLIKNQDAGVFGRISLNFLEIPWPVIMKHLKEYTFRLDFWHMYLYYEKTFPAILVSLSGLQLETILVGEFDAKDDPLVENFKAMEKYCTASLLVTNDDEDSEDMEEVFKKWARNNDKYKSRIIDVKEKSREKSTGYGIDRILLDLLNEKLDDLV